MYAAVHNLRWRANSAKICILIADAPPHGLGEPGDGFQDGSPDGKRAEGERGRARTCS